MKRKIVLATGAVAVAGGAFFFLQGGARNSPVPEHPPHAREAPVGSFAEFGSAHHGSPSNDESPTTTDFSERARRILMMPMEVAREEAIRTLAQEWAGTDSAAAERWAMSLDVPEERERALTHICTQSATTDPLRAIRIACAHELHEGLIQAAASIWASKDADAATEWADTLPDGDLRDRVHLQLLLVRADSDPSSAAARVTELYPSGTMQDEAIIAVLHRWLRQDADEAREWVSTFAEGKLKERAMGEIQGMITTHSVPETN